MDVEEMGARLGTEQNILREHGPTGSPQTQGISGRLRNWQ